MWGFSCMSCFWQRKAVLHHLYLGRNPPMFSDLRVLHQSGDDDHLVFAAFFFLLYLLDATLVGCNFVMLKFWWMIQVLELGMSFLSADDMSAKLAIRLRKRLGFGIKTNMHITSMHVEGKVHKPSPILQVNMHVILLIMHIWNLFKVCLVA